MGYRFEIDEPMDLGARRIAAERLGLAVDLIDEPDRLGLEDSVHEIRKRCKELRALSRLLEPHLGFGHDHFDALVRSAAAGLGDVRDAHVLVDTFARITGAGTKSTKKAEKARKSRSEAATAATRRRAEAGVAIGERLSSDAERLVPPRRLVDARLADARARLVQAARVVETWQVPADVRAVTPGLTATHDRACRRLARARASGSVDALHRWRRWANHLRFQVRLLEAADPDRLGPLTADLSELTESLGLDHDLALLARRLHADGRLAHGRADREAHRRLEAEIASDRARLQRRCLEIADEVFALPTERFVGDLAAAWTRRAAEAGRVEAGGVEADAVETGQRSVQSVQSVPVTSR